MQHNNSHVRSKGQIGARVALKEKIGIIFIAVISLSIFVNLSYFIRFLSF